MQKFVATSLNSDGGSLTEAYLQTLSPAKKRELLALLAERASRWRFQARPEQLTPPGDWFIWWIDAGRGWGKTRTAAETLKEWALATPGSRWALVAATIADARDTMIEGESGLLTLFKPHELRGGSADTAFNRSMGELYLANGALFKTYSSEKPRKLRGPQHHGAWCDELAAWEDAPLGMMDEKDLSKGNGTTWSNLLFGLRLGKNPRIIIASTPKPVKLVFDLLAYAKANPGRVYITKGTTYDNLSNLSDTFKQNVVAVFEGTSMGRQELNAELNMVVKGALWTRVMLNPIQVDDVPPMRRIVVAVDPAVTADEDSDETGIVVVGIGFPIPAFPDGLLYVLEDASGIYTPLEWATVADRLYQKWEADCIVAEVNNGGDLVEVNVRQVNKTARYRGVRASRGKVTRAEPVVALYEKGRVRHRKGLDDLETQMTTWSAGTGEKSPDKIDATVWGITELALAPTLVAKAL
jgi:phage terminase large subunit-like protein